MRILKLDENTKKNLLEDLLKRSPNQYTEYEERVAVILNAVKLQKDQAIFDFTKKFDGASIDASTIRVTEDEIREAYEAVDATLLDIIRKAKKNIQEYHEKQRQYSWFDSKPNGSLLGQKVTPLQRVGVYVPGGKAVYPSSVLMNIMPAKVAGVEEIVMVTPPGKDGKVNPNTLVAAKEAGADVIYKVGGAQAIGALAYGTESIPKVDKIVGPGNIYVALAKKAVYGHVSIDAIAGPSEILVIADETANPRYVAADLLSQAEHDELASAILVTTSEKLAKEVSEQVDIFVEELSRTEIMRKSLDNYGYILVADTMEDVIDIANEIASEHLEIMTKNPYDVMMKIRNAGAIFIGEYSSEPLGDYFAGPNHVLPTNGTAKFFSPLSVDDFIKKSSIIAYSKEALEKIHVDIEQFAKAGADIIGFHVEAGSDVDETIDLIHSFGKKACLTIKPKTPAEAVFPYLEKLDMVLVMSVEPGFGGQAFMPESLPKITAIREKANELGLEIDIEVDGGINLETAPLATKAGANVLVTGNVLFSAEDKTQRLKELREIVK